ncbi:hypothetical protein pEaSNUABM50_00385 [Erwinia phage pEa_SNUABM_50]|uniref:Uncharacterized protein n=4 Tax=Eneladusvirus BF TaxID=2560751 RepID=A0A7L8ZNK6_9CAUD|nr:hypothetical protein FDH34_gp534 [Serratia phage BF]QOI71324.1 hypothetical protein pEaSNUABM12_00390 [Erwinia phage pEa_SNUABM_12]QOI71867.1 hypothetical protein pEaSNUABM47_00387 [Erwinia phage pEa_SNUABM_47]QOI72406.1 hypothetical protein pEaSNUABM50_00385 [Erwinia phage pEa_SNUABM_50]QXO11533.1 hypothetical protein pEaSNUABM19_00391 [Erwinia phage pEa_SNUABM_19]QXO12081.1 hypothetical protein pEaSNUABM44_00389 [Erwinia phage pEa_SNUABM_44]QXO12633.1 hypothetical protein pEaSNUABM49_003
MNEIVRKQLHDIANNAHCIYTTIIRERVKYSKFGSKVGIQIDNAIQFSNTPDKFEMWIKFGKHTIIYTDNSVIYRYWDSKKPDKHIYDVIDLPDINKFQFTEEYYFQYSTLFNFKYLELEDLKALDTIRRKVQNIWSTQLLCW